jgi:hypothetical protein
MPLEWTIDKRIQEGEVMMCRNLRLRTDGSTFLDLPVYDLKAPIQDFMQRVRVLRLTETSSPAYNKAEVEMIPPFSTDPVRLDPRERKYGKRAD